MKYKISIAVIGDTKEIMSFISHYWKKDHVLAKSEELFLFQYQNYLSPSELNMVVAKNSDGEIKAILGFVPASYGSEQSDVFGALWKVADDVKAPMLGLKLLSFLRKKVNGRYLTLGLNETSSSIYRYMNFEVGYMTQWYIGNAQCSAKLTMNIEFPELDDSFQSKVIEPNEELFSLLSLNNSYPKKDREYIQHRFVEHPIYDYEFIGIFSKDKLSACMVIREQQGPSSKCIRIVDYIGDDSYLAGSAASIKKLLKERGAEYADLIAFGLAQDVLESGGFRKVNGDVVVPNYFEPFELKTIDILCAYDNSEATSIRIFKADGDQDRPNVI